MQDYVQIYGYYKKKPYEFEEKEIKKFIQNSKSMTACRLLEKQYELYKQTLFTGFQDMSGFSSI